MTRRRLPIVLIALSAAAAAVCATEPGPAALRLPFGLALLWLLPGWAWALALWPSRQDLAERLFVVAGAGLALGIVASVEIAARGVLDAGWTIGVAVALTVVPAIVAILRTRDAGPVAVRVPRPRWRVLGLVAGGMLAALLVATAVGVARTPFGVPADRGYTVLSVDGVIGTRSLVVGIRSEEASPKSFVLRTTMPGGRQTSRTIELAPGQERRAVVRVGAGRGTGPVEIALLREDGDASPYRRLRINLPIPPPARAVADGETTW
jgi:hypothetical protein